MRGLCLCHIHPRRRSRGLGFMRNEPGISRKTRTQCEVGFFKMLFFRIFLCLVVQLLVMWQTHYIECVTWAGGNISPDFPLLDSPSPSRLLPQVYGRVPRRFFSWVGIRVSIRGPLQHETAKAGLLKETSAIALPSLSSYLSLSRLACPSFVNRAACSGALLCCCFPGPTSFPPLA